MNRFRTKRYWTAARSATPDICIALKPVVLVFYNFPIKLNDEREKKAYHYILSLLFQRKYVARAHKQAHKCN